MVTRAAYADSTGRRGKGYRRAVTGELTSPERRLRVLLIAHAAWSAVLAIAYIVGGDTASLGFLPNSFAKDVLFVALSAVAAADLRRVRVSAPAALLAWMAADLILAVLFTWWWIAAVRSRHRLRYLHPIAYLSLVALAEVLVEGRSEAVTPTQVARNVDAY